MEMTGIFSLFRQRRILLDLAGEGAEMRREGEAPLGKARTMTGLARGLRQAGKGKLILRLPPGRAVCLRAKFPVKANKTEIDRSAAAILDRDTFWGAEQLYFDCREQAGEWVIVAAPKALVEDWLVAAARWGMRPDSVEAPEFPHFNLTPSVRKTAATGWRSHFAAWGAVASLAMMMAGLAYPIMQYRSFEARLAAQEIPDLSDEAIALQRLETGLADLRRRAEVLRRNGGHGAMFIAVLEDEASLGGTPSATLTAVRSPRREGFVDIFQPPG